MSRAQAELDGSEAEGADIEQFGRVLLRLGKPHAGTIDRRADSAAALVGIGFRMNEKTLEVLCHHRDATQAFLRSLKAYPSRDVAAGIIDNLEATLAEIEVLLGEVEKLNSRQKSSGSQG